MRIYISGAITGHDPEEAKADFEQAEQHLRLTGFEPVNPQKLDHEPDALWVECMMVDLRALHDCDAIAMLPGWENSDGAQIERYWAEVKNKPIVYLENALFEKVVECK